MNSTIVQEPGYQGARQADVNALVEHEAALLDEGRFEEWLELFSEDGLYWVPGDHGDATDPRLELSIVYDDDAARRLRVERLRSGRQFAQEPASRTCHVISVMRAEDDDGDDLIRVSYNVVIYEARLDRIHFFPGRCTLKLRRDANGLRIVLKKVVLINRDHYIDNLTFLL